MLLLLDPVQERPDREGVGAQRPGRDLAVQDSAVMSELYVDSWPQPWDPSSAVTRTNPM